MWYAKSSLSELVFELITIELFPEVCWRVPQAGPTPRSECAIPDPNGPTFDIRHSADGQLPLPQLRYAYYISN